MANIDPTRKCLVAGAMVPQQRSPLKALRQRCLDCSGGSPNEVTLCAAESCPSWPFRLGKNPYRTVRVMTEEQRAEAAERLRKARVK